MAFAERAYWEQDTKHGFTDRIEIHEDGFVGSAIQLGGDETGFTFRHDEITSESNDGLLNIHANKIQVGKLEFRPRIDPTNSEELSLLEDIRDSSNRQFQMIRKKDGVVWWKGYITTKIFSYPERGSNYIAQIRATDLDLLKGVEYTLDDTRQTLITTISDILSELSLGLDIRTQTSWITEFTTDSTDFLQQIYHETKALRVFANNGDEEDTTISKFQALEYVCAPALLIKQINGAFYVDQISEFDDPQNVNQTVYNPDGTVKTATTTVDFRQTGYTQASSGTPSVKIISENTSYPGIKRALTQFKHRTKVSGINLPEEIELADSTTDAYSQLFISDGSQKIELSFSVYAETDEDESDVDGRVRINIVGSSDTYWLQDDFSWDTTSNNYVELALTKGKALTGGGNVWRGSFNIVTDDIPADADGTLNLQFAGATGGIDFADTTIYISPRFRINNPVASENSTSINYEIYQTPEYEEVFNYGETIFGDGPTNYSISALRYGTGDGQTTADSWQRRGTAINYRNFHENLLKEIIDFQRVNTRKIQADIWGDYDPSKILVYDGNNYYYTAGTYESVYGRWSATLLKVSENTGTDTFEDLLLFDSSTAGIGIDSATNSVIFRSDKYADAQKITTTTSALSGTVTSIPIVSIGEVFVSEGDTFYVFDVENASLTSFVLDAPMLPDSTTLSVQSKALSQSISDDSWVIYTGDIISTFITRSDTAIRLGVTNVDYLQNGDDNEYLTDENGDPIINGESDPGSYLTLLEDELVAKVTAGGLLALVRLGVDVEEERSIIELEADNINLNGLITAINGSEDDATQIDGGKIKADTSITVGSGDDVVVLSGADDTWRIWAGNAEPASAPFRVDKDGNVIATSVTTLTGGVSGTINDFTVSNVKTTATIDDTDVETLLNAGIITVSFDVTTGSENGTISIDADSNIPIIKNEYDNGTNTRTTSLINGRVIAENDTQNVALTTITQATDGSANTEEVFVEMSSDYELGDYTNYKTIGLALDGTLYYLRAYKVNA